MTSKPHLLLIAAIACTATSVSAQKMYRCSNTYQDHPCSGGQESKVLSHGAKSAPAEASPASGKVNLACSQRGVAAQKIKWVREAGQTQQQQEAAASSGMERDLIADVYSRQGTSGQVRAAIEADCMAEHERAARAAALLEAANALPTGRPSSAPRSVSSNSPSDVTAAPNANAQPQGDAGMSNNSAATRKQACQRLTDQLNDVRARQRTGADASSMDELRRQHQDITNKLRGAGC